MEELTYIFLILISFTTGMLITSLIDHKRYSKRIKSNLCGILYLIKADDEYAAGLELYKGYDELKNEDFVMFSVKH